jgi:TRAP transporter TAXI family solute receptor
MKNKFLSVSIPIILIIVASFYITSQFIQPEVKKEFTIATGSKDGQYYKTAMIYKKILEDEKVKVNILTTSGSVENLQLLNEKKVDMAFVQNGIPLKDNKSKPQAIASIYYEPLWLFYRNLNFNIEYMIELITKKISVGKDGSGTKDLALRILKQNGLNNENTIVLSEDTTKAKELLIKGEIDAMFLVSSVNSKTVQELLENQNISLFNFKRAKAYSRKYNFLESITLYEGTIDLYKNIPFGNKNLLSTTATLVVNEDFPDELTRLVLKKIKNIHNKKELFETSNYFPNISNLTFPINEEAIRYFQYGDTWLEKIFPYWIASNVDRLKLLIIPLLTLLIPLSRGLFPLYKWSIRSKIFRWYDKIQDIDNQIDSLNKQDLENKLEELIELKKEIKKETKVPKSYMGEYYNLIIHLEHIISDFTKKISIK